MKRNDPWSCKASGRCSDQGSFLFVLIIGDWFALFFDAESVFSCVYSKVLFLYIFHGKNCFFSTVKDGFSPKNRSEILTQTLLHAIMIVTGQIESSMEDRLMG